MPNPFKSVYLLASMLVLLLFSQCKSEPFPAPPAPQNPIDTNDPDPGGKACHPDTVYFERDVMPILSSNCAMSGCHAPPVQKGVNLTNYAQVMATADVRAGDPDGSDLYEVISESDPDKIMPPQGRTPLSSAQIALIRKWIQQGAQNLKCDDCDTADVRYSLSIVPILQANCLSCHSSSSASGGLDLSTHLEVVNAIQNKDLLQRIKHNPNFPPMPPSGNKLSDCDLRKFDIWLANGLPNN